LALATTPEFPNRAGNVNGSNAGIVGLEIAGHSARRYQGQELEEASPIEAAGVDWCGCLVTVERGPVVPTKPLTFRSASVSWNAAQRE
jgi:hypothetical protein